MKCSATSPRKQGFSLIELLAVIAIIGILFTLVSPQIGKAQLRAKLTKESAKARYIVEAITAMGTGSRFSGGWPKSGGENTESSTVFLNELVKGGYLDVDYAFFAAPGMVPARDEAEFLSGGEEHNAWCILLDLNDTVAGNTPAVYTKNLDINELSFSETAEPFGNKGFAFATKNGEAVVVEQKEMNSEDFKDIFNLEKLSNVSAMTP